MISRRDRCPLSTSNQNKVSNPSSFPQASASGQQRPKVTSLQPVQISAWGQAFRSQARYLALVVTLQAKFQKGPGDIVYPNLQVPGDFLDSLAQVRRNPAKEHGTIGGLLFPCAVALFLCCDTQLFNDGLGRRCWWNNRGKAFERFLIIGCCSW
jgi:hypothetical protein